MAVAMAPVRGLLLAAEYTVSSAQGNTVGQPGIPQRGRHGQEVDPRGPLALRSPSLPTPVSLSPCFLHLGIFGEVLADFPPSLRSAAPARLLADTRGDPGIPGKGGHPSGPALLALCSALRHVPTVQAPRT